MIVKAIWCIDRDYSAIIDSHAWVRAFIHCINYVLFCHRMHQNILLSLVVVFLEVTMNNKIIKCTLIKYSISGKRSTWTYCEQFLLKCSILAFLLYYYMDVEIL